MRTVLCTLCIYQCKRPRSCDFCFQFYQSNLKTELCISSYICTSRLKYYLHHTLGGCPYGQDGVWKIIWPATNASTTARQKCPGSSESQGDDV